MNILFIILSILLLIIVLSITLFQVVIPFFYLRYIKRMNNENCDCSVTFSRKFLTFYAIYVYVALILVIFCMVNMPIKTIHKHAQSETNIVINVGFSFLIAYYLYTYARKMIDKKCKCAQSWELKVMKYHSYIQFVLVFIASLNIIAILLN